MRKGPHGPIKKMKEFIVAYKIICGAGVVGIVFLAILSLTLFFMIKALDSMIK